MIRFPEFEALGLRLAGMTEAADGDFAGPPRGRHPVDALSIAGDTSQRAVRTLRQVHGTSIVFASAATPSDGEEADGLATRDAQIVLGVRVADCVPVFLFDPVVRAIALVHAGRQGTHQAISAAAVHALTARFASVPSRLHALVGPSAGPCCYEVSEPLADAFRARGHPASGRFLDLWRANSHQLERCGVPSANISIAGICTICSDRFHSYRATGTASRNLAVLGL